MLLTAYADTGAAIDAINVVDLDHYLLKPWDPPEEKLYPVVDALLDAWMASDHRPVPETKVVGHRWSARSSEVREFLARNQVPYRWYSSEEPEGQRLLTATGADGLSLPVVITPDGDPLIEPTDAELAARVGLATTPAKDFYNLVVVGGGRPGSVPRCTAPRRGCAPCWSSSLRPAARPGRAHGSRTTWASPTGVSGAQLDDRARRQAAKFGAEVLTTREVTGLEVRGSARRVTFADGTIIVLGETLTGVVGGLASQPVSALTMVVGLVAVVVGFGAWWTYFDFAGHRCPRPEPVASLQWMFSHLPLTAAIAAMGAAMVSLVDHAHDGRTPAATAWVLSAAPPSCWARPC